jgi:hypothetical protein
MQYAAQQWTGKTEWRHPPAGTQTGPLQDEDIPCPVRFWAVRGRLNSASCRWVLPHTHGLIGVLSLVSLLGLILISGLLAPEAHDCAQVKFTAIYIYSSAVLGQCTRALSEALEVPQLKLC